ncbi:unnamed protein product [Camellia sinensis]
MAEHSVLDQLLDSALDDFQNLQSYFFYIKQLQISEKKPSSSIPGGSLEKKIVPIKRPDNGGTLAFRNTRLFANHFPVKFNPQSIIMHYDVDIKPNMPPGSRAAKRPISKSDLRLITDKLFSDDPTRFPELISTYDGEKNIFSAVPLPTGTFYVELSGGEDTAPRSYRFTIELVNELKVSKLNDYLRGMLSYVPREIFQGMDLVMKDNPSRHMNSVGRSFFSKEFRPNDDLGYGVAAFRGFQQSLKATAQGLALCLDSSVLALRKRLPVLDFLMEQGFQLNDVRTSRREVMREVMHVLKGLKVHVTHRLTNQKYTIAGFSDQNTRDITFTLEDREGENPPREIGLVEYFREKYNRELRYQDMPCLDLGKGNRKNYVPMEFCVLVDGQGYPKEHLDRDQALFLKQISLPRPRERKDTIYGMVRSEDGPCGYQCIKDDDLIGSDDDLIPLEKTKPSSVQTCRTLIILSGEATGQTTVVIRASNAQNLTLFFGCSQIPVLQLGSSGQFNCSVNGIDDRNFYLTRSTLFSKSTISCFSSVIVPVFQSAAQALEGNSSSSTSLKAALDGGFGLQWSANSDLCSQCVTSGGQCGYESGSSSFTCFCSDKAYASSCSATQNDLGNSLMRILNIAAFAVSRYSCTEGRNCKPFNPLLGETYEAAYPDLRFISKKLYLDHNQLLGESRMHSISTLS